MATDYLTGIKAKIEKGDLKGAERDLHHLIVNKDFMKVWGRDDLPVLWGHIAHMTLDESCPTAMVDLRDGKVCINPTFLLEKINSIEDLLFIILHERDHRLLRRIYRVDWFRLRKILDFKDEWVAKVRNVLEDAWINASVRSSMGIDSGLVESFYCWTQDDVDNPGAPTPENPTASGFDPSEGHKLGEPKSEEFAMLTCLSPFVNADIQKGHEGLYSDADDLLKKHGLQTVSHRTAVPRRSRNRRRYNYNYDYGSMLSFPEWYRVFCDWLDVHKDDLAQPSPGSEHDEGCPQHGNGDTPGEGGDDGDSPGEGGSGDGDSPGDGSGEGEGEGEGSGSGSGKGSGKGKGDGKDQDGGDGADKNDPAKGHGHGGNKPCTCNGGNGLLGEPMTLKERLARVPDILASKDDTDKSLDKDLRQDAGDKDPNGKDQPLEVMELDPRKPKGVSWGGKVHGTEIVPQEIEDLDDFDRGLLEMGGSTLTDSHKTDTVQIKGAVKRYADDLVQNIATMRVTDHKIVRPDFNMPQRPSRRDMMNLGMGHMPPMWDHNQYLEQNELIVYTDVSGSMCNWYSVALYLTKQLREFGCTAYQFSTVVCEPMPGRDDNVFWGTGGTHFNAVAQHIQEKGFKSVIIITDNCDNLSPEWHTFLKDEVPELYLVFLEDGQRPRNLDEQDYGWGGGYRARGFQGTSENITGIFDSDVGKK